MSKEKRLKRQRSL